MGRLTFVVVMSSVITIRWFCVLWIVLVLPVPVCSQVVNDSVHRRIELQMGIPHASYTAQSTVERNCVDESLTGKCIKYHNDQWFYFSSGNRRPLFINVADQQCRDLNGVQLVLLTGEPCRPDSYSILSCTSSGTNDDFYVEADVSPNTTYLLIVDGYLEDFCEFDITLDSIPRGLPPEPNVALPSDGELVGKVVRLRWELPDSLSEETARFIVYRRDQRSYRFAAHDTVAVGRNALGDVPGEYNYTDTLDDHRTYFYRVVVQDYPGQQYLFAEYSFRWQEARKIVRLPLDYRNGTSLTINVWDAFREEVLERQTLVYQKDNPTLRLDLTKYWEEGHREVAVEVIDDKNSADITVVDLIEIGYR